MSPPTAAAADAARCHLPAGSTAQGPYDVVITPASAGWGHASLRVLDLGAHQEVELDTGDSEVVVVPLHGAVVVLVDGVEHSLAGRTSPFAGPTDVLHLPQGARAVLRGSGSSLGSRVALAGAVVPAGAARLPVQHVPAADVPVELRGAGRCSRQVHGLADAGSPLAHAVIVVEVLTPAGNWSSYPPHKHDTASAEESELEEVYYYEVAPGPGGQPGVGHHRTYGTSERPIDVLVEVRSGDAVLVPHGWHGPCAATPGHDLYYLNVMAGPGPERAWRIVDDPDLAWVRATWADQDVDPRLPLGAPPDAAPIPTPTRGGRP